MWTFPCTFCKYILGKIDTPFLRNYLLCVINIFILIPWELWILHRIALIKIPASFSYFTHLLVFLSYVIHSFTLRVSWLRFAWPQLCEPSKTRGNQFLCEHSQPWKASPKNLLLLHFSIWKCIYHKFFILKTIRLKAIYYGNRHKYLQLIKAISNFRHPHPPCWLGKETRLFQVMLPALLRKKIH